LGEQFCEVFTKRAAVAELVPYFQPTWDTEGIGLPRFPLQSESQPIPSNRALLEALFDRFFRIFRDDGHRHQHCHRDGSD